MKEIPPHNLKKNGQPGMHLLYGFIEGNHRFRAYVPTTVYDYKSAEIRVYELTPRSEQQPNVPEELIVRERVPLKSLPTWNTPYQCLLLTRRDEKAVKKAMGELEKKLLDE